MIESGSSPHDVPEYRADVMRPRSHRYCIAVFVINEGERVRKQLRAMKPQSGVIDIVVADGGSTDGSLDLNYLAECGVRARLTKLGPGKLSAQMRMAFSWALEEGYDGVVVIDGNGKDGVEAVPNFIRLLDEGFDHIQGSRFINGGHAVNTPLVRLLSVRAVHAPLISLASGERHTDTTNGFRAYSRRLLADDQIAIFRNVFDSYELHYHLAIESSRLDRFRTVETPVSRTYPKGGKTPTKISPIRGNLHVLAVLFRAIRGRYRHQPLPADVGAME